MKIYYIYPDDYDYEQYREFVVVAENEKKALELVCHKFDNNQGEIHVGEFDLTKEQILSEYFYGV